MSGVAGLATALILLTTPAHAAGAGLGPSALCPRAVCRSPSLRRNPALPRAPLAAAEAVSRGEAGHENAATGSLPQSPPSPVPAAPSPSATKEVLSGITVALASLPSSVAFANIAGVSPLVGVWSSVVLGLAAPALGSRPGVISGAAGVVVVPLAPVVAAKGPTIVPVVTFLAAGLEALCGLLGLGRLVSLVSDAAMTGFLNGLGLLLVRSQLKVFATAPNVGAAVGIAALTAALVQLLPRFTSSVPASLGAVVASAAAAKALGLPAATLATAAGGDAFAGGIASLPAAPVLPPFSRGVLAAAAVPACSIALISMLETLLAAKVVDERQRRSPTSPDQSTLAMAAGNAISAALGGFGGCGLIPQTLLNAQSGGAGRLSALAYAVAMGAFVLFLAPLVGAVPLACLAGIMITVGATTVQWKPTADAARDVLAGRRLPEAAALAVASVLCFCVDMAVGIVVGVAVERVCRLLARRAGAEG